MPASYLNGSLREERAALWSARLEADPPENPFENATHLVVAEEDGTLHGFAYLIRQPDGRMLVENLHVLPARKRSGIGRELLRRAFAWAAADHPGTPVYLEVLRDNAAAVAFYERNGGRVTKEFVERFAAGFELPVLEYTWDPDAVAAVAGDVLVA
ncbi:GNAT family N-acetyltransferase [Nonomuraea antri]|uniref:GNAT family N-acetyltransferase n=1 Tax=Nonomuraea antri TaxID=2730852 RepID=UPI001C2C41ED|nr:GNAT family N-acetyltransferase [Nonomuraea antri]